MAPSQSQSPARQSLSPVVGMAVVEREEGKTEAGWVAWVVVQELVAVAMVEG